LGTGKPGRTPPWLQIFGIHNLVSLLFSVVWCNIFHPCVGLIINDDRSIEFFIKLYLACTNLDDIAGSSPFNFALERGFSFTGWLNFLLTGG
jgi:hypothetical protein